jgi:hypothetical protein
MRNRNNCSSIHVAVHGGSPPFYVELIGNKTGKVVATLGAGWEEGNHTWDAQFDGELVYGRVTDSLQRTVSTTQLWKLEYGSEGTGMSVRLLPPLLSPLPLQDGSLTPPFY